MVNFSSMDFEAQKEALERKEVVQNYMEEKKISELFQVNENVLAYLSLVWSDMWKVVGGDTVVPTNILGTLNRS